MNDPGRPSNGGFNGDEDRIGALIRLAGRREPVPVERRKRVEAAVRDHWHRDVRRRGWRRGFAMAALPAAALLVAAIGLGLRQLGTSETPASAGPARVAVSSGTSWLHPDPEARPSDRRALAAGDTIPAGAELRTGPDGRVALALASGRQLRLDAGTRLRVVASRSFHLHDGAVYADSGLSAGESEAAAFEIGTRFGPVRDVGTQFEVRLADSGLSVRVREGSVSVDRTEGTLLVEAGGELALGADGSLERGTVSPFDPVWSWAHELAPPMEIRGRTLSEFLDWAARERGLAIRFDEPGLAGSATTIVLGGSIEGLTPDQALDAVLPTCGMAHRIERGTLIVRAETTSPN